MTKSSNNVKIHSANYSVLIHLGVDQIMSLPTVYIKVIFLTLGTIVAEIVNMVKIILTQKSNIFQIGMCCEIRFSDLWMYLLYIYSTGDCYARKLKM
jgi:hypothetical protein